MTAPVTAHRATTEYVTFGLGGEVYGIELSRVRELVGGQDVNHVSSAAPFIRGVVELRGKAFAVVDLRVELGMPAVPVTRRSVVMIVRVEGAPSHVMAGLLVDEVFGVSPYTDGEVAPARAFAAGRVSLVAGIARLSSNRVVGAAIWGDS